MHDLLSAIGIESIPPGETEESLCKKICADNFFFNKVIARLVELEAVATAKNLFFLEREALRNKIIPKQKKPEVVWGVIQPSASADGEMWISATCGNETTSWHGKNIRAYRFHGEPVPAEIVYLYEQYQKVPRSPFGEMDRRILAQDKETAKQYVDKNRPLSSEEALAAAALAKQFPKG